MDSGETTYRAKLPRNWFGIRFRRGALFTDENNLVWRWESGGWQRVSTLYTCLWPAVANWDLPQHKM